MSPTRELRMIMNFNDKCITFLFIEQPKPQQDMHQTAIHSGLDKNVGKVQNKFQIQRCINKHIRLHKILVRPSKSNKAIHACISFLILYSKLKSQQKLKWVQSYHTWKAPKGNSILNHIKKLLMMKNLTLSGKIFVTIQKIRNFRHTKIFAR